MYGQNNYAPHYGQGSQNPRPPFPQNPLNPHFQQGRPPLQFPHLAPPPVQDYHLPPRPQQVHASSAPNSYPNGHQNTQWICNTGVPRPGTFRQELFQLPVPYRGSMYPPQPNNQIFPPPPPRPRPNSSFFTHAPMFSMGHNPPPLPPLPPTVPPSPPPKISVSAPIALETASVLPHFSKSGPNSTFFAVEMMGSDSADKVAAATEHMNDTSRAGENRNLSDVVAGSPGLEIFSPEEGDGFDLSLPPPKPAEDSLVRKIELLCRFIAKNGPDFEQKARQKESAKTDFGFLFGGELGTEAAVAHEYFKWVRNKSLLQQHRESNLAVRVPEVRTKTQTTLMDGDASPSVSDMEMEDDFMQSDRISGDTALIPEEHVNQEELGGPQNIAESNPPPVTVPTSTQLPGEEIAIRYTLSLQNDQPMDGIASSKVDSFDASSTGAAMVTENIYLGGSSPSLEDTKPTMKSHGDLIEGANPFKLLQDYASDDDSECDGDPLVEEVSPVIGHPSNRACSSSLSGEIESNLKDQGPKIILSSSSNYQESLPKSQSVAQEASTSGTVKAEEFVKISNEHPELAEVAVSPEAFGEKDLLDVSHGGASEKRKPQYQTEDKQRTSIVPKVDEFGRLIRDVASDSDPDESHPNRRFGKRGRSRSRSPYDRSRRSPRRRREKRSWSCRRRSRSRSRSPSHRRGIESGGERMRRDKTRLPDCLDFLRSRCHRGESCRYMHPETNKNAAGRNRNTKPSILHEEVEKLPSKRLLHEHDGSNKSSIKNETLDSDEFLNPEKGFVQDDRTLVADVCESERSSGTTAMMVDGADIKEDMFKSENRREKESEYMVIEKSQDRKQTERNESDFCKNVLSIFHQGDHLDPPASSTLLPHETGIHLPREGVQPPINYPYQSQFQMQQPHHPTPPNNWHPPPSPLLQSQFVNNFSQATSIQGVSAPPFQQNHFPSRNDSSMSQHHSHPAPPLDSMSKPLTTDNAVRQTYGSHLSSFPLPPLGPMATNSIQSFSGNNFPTNNFSAPSSQSHAYPLQPQPQHGLHRPSSDGLRFGDYGNIPPFGGSKIILHHNPYASAFDQPFDSKINSTVSNQGKDLPFANPYDPSHNISQTSVDSQAVMFPPKTAQAAELPKSGTEKYDPLFDSIEPFSDSFKKSGQRLSCSGDVGENYKQKEVETADVCTSMKSNDEFGEMADAEVDEVESGKSSNPQDGGHTEVGEVENDQVKTPGKDKKSKDSRSMKLFKSSLAEYVKEVLKPHWRQGGMSKEAFKMIVKKTIDKVCGAMKSHHVPKSQEKINRYIDSSERKLNKLVMGYVDKYAKI